MLAACLLAGLSLGFATPAAAIEVGETLKLPDLVGLDGKPLPAARW
ncbi:MAG: hypothetical protein MO853_04370 [Candidatus Protistobacter heckmanni]|nr:hypothetical protein [Candidatus Protistobacter heckmanni]